MANSTKSKPAKKTASKTIATPRTFAPFTYGKPGPRDVNVFPMTPGNAAPGLIVWLFLVSCPDFLDALDAPDGGASSKLVSAKEIAGQTNLTEPCVNRILDIYRKSPSKPLFRQVIDQFQSYVKDDGGYDRSNCPNGPIGPIGNDGVAAAVSTQGKNVILKLAKSGAGVVPNTPDVPDVVDKTKPAKRGRK